MRKMKDSGIEWIGEIPEDWKTVKLKRVATIMTGNTPTKTKDNEFYSHQDGYMWIKAEDLGSNYPIEKTTEYLTREGIECGRLFPSKTVYVCCIASVGKVGYAEKKASCNQQINGITFKDMYWKYGYYMTLAQEKEYLANASGNVMKILNAEKQSMFDCPCPRFDVQKNISEFLDKKCAEIDTIISAKEKTNELLKERRQSIIYEAVTKGLNHTVPMKDSGIEWIGEIPKGWATIRVKHLATEKDSLFLDGDWINSDVITDEGIRYLTSGNVGEGFYKEQGKGYISEETFKKLNCLAAFPGDLMISRLNEPVGRCCIIPNGEDYYVVAVDNVILRPDQNFCKKYLLYCMNTNGYANAALMAASGTTMQRISRTALGNLTIPVATYAEQVTIADYLDEKCSEIDAIISANDSTIEKLKEYRQSIIYEAVTGKVEI